MISFIMAVVITAATASWIVGTMLPLVTALASHADASEKVKAIVALVVGVLGGVLTQLTVNGVDAVLTVSSIPVVFQVIVTQFATYQILWKRVLDINSVMAPHFGIGKPAAEFGDAEDDGPDDSAALRAYAAELSAFAPTAKESGELR